MDFVELIRPEELFPKALADTLDSNFGDLVFHLDSKSTVSSFASLFAPVSPLINDLLERSRCRCEADMCAEKSPTLHISLPEHSKESLDAVMEILTKKSSTFDPKYVKSIIRDLGLSNLCPAEVVEISDSHSPILKNLEFGGVNDTLFSDDLSSETTNEEDMTMPKVGNTHALECHVIGNLNNLNISAPKPLEALCDTEDSLDDEEEMTINDFRVEIPETEENENLEPPSKKVKQEEKIIIHQDGSNDCINVEDKESLKVKCVKTQVKICLERAKLQEYSFQNGGKQISKSDGIKPKTKHSRYIPTIKNFEVKCQYPECRKKDFLSLVYLVNHMSVTHYKNQLGDLIQNPEECPDCDFKSNCIREGNRIADVLRHLGSVHSRLQDFLTDADLNNLMYCSLRSQTSFSRLNMLDEEVKKRGINGKAGGQFGKKVICPKCLFEGATPEVIARHHEDAHGKSGGRAKRFYPCPDKNCPVRTKKLCQVLSHLCHKHYRDQLRGLIKVPHQCPECPKKIYEINSMVGHIGTFHQNLYQLLTDNHLVQLSKISGNEKYFRHTTNAAVLRELQSRKKII